MTQISRRAVVTGALPLVALGTTGCSAAQALTGSSEPPGSTNVVAVVQSLDGYFAGLSDIGRTAYDVDDLLPGVRSALTIDDELYALPFDAAGVTMPDAPTWEDVRGFGLTLNSPTMRGLDVRLAPEAGGLDSFMTVVNSFGARWFDENWNPRRMSSEFRLPRSSPCSDPRRRRTDPGDRDVRFRAGGGAEGAQCDVAGLHRRGRPALDPLISSVSDTVGHVKAPTQGCSNGSAWLYS